MLFLPIQPAIIFHVVFRMTENTEFKIDGNAVASTLECPVCLNVPREIPIPQCPEGHIVCKDCRPSLNTCPTCRRRLLENNSSIAASLIDQIPHKCKFNEFGCKEKRFLSDIVNHERECPERTVRCAVHGCSQVVKLKMFSQHAKDCFGLFTEDIEDDGLFITTTVWDGWLKSEVPTEEEFDFVRDYFLIQGTSFIQHNKRFYIYKRYSSMQKCFIFCVLIGEEKTIAKKYLATIEIENYVTEMSTSITCPVLSLEDFTESTLDMDNSPSVWKIPYEMMRNMFQREEIESDKNSGDEPKKWGVFYDWKVTMKEKKTVL